MNIYRKKDMLKRKITYYIYAFVIIIIMFFWLFPQIMSIGKEKYELAEIANEYNKIHSQGFTFVELKKEIASLPGYTDKPGIVTKDVKTLKEKVEEVYFKKLLGQLSPAFYKIFFENKTGNYLDFLKGKKEEIAEKKLSDSVIQRRESLNKILPFYGDKKLINEKKENGIYDDTNFILYIERIIEAFNLENSGDIGISNLASVEREVGYNLEKFSSIDNGIYSFNIDLEIRGAKEDFLNFIHYIENVGNVALAGNKIKISNDKALRNKIPGEKETNIYAHPIMEIQKLIMPDYIDKSLDLREKQSLSEFIKEVSPREEFKAYLTVSFFVRGQPEYKKENFIEEVYDKYNKLKSKVGLQLKIINNRNFIQKTDKAVIFRRDTQKILNYLTNINKAIMSDYKNSKKPEGINGMYKKFTNYGEVLDKLDLIVTNIEGEISLIKSGK